MPQHLYPQPSSPSPFGQEGICDLSVKRASCVVHAGEFEYGEVVFEHAQDGGVQVCWPVARYGVDEFRGCGVAVCPCFDCA